MFQRKYYNALMRVALADFSDLVHEDKYDKIGYHAWKELNRNKEDLLIEWSTNVATNTPVIKITPESNKFTWTFNAADNSFGQFLYENYLEEYEKMSKINCNYSDSVSGQGNYLSYDIKSTPSTDVISVCNTPNICFNPDIYDKIISMPITKKENVKMKTFNFDFGPVNGNIIRMSMYGLAVKNKAGTYVSYNVGNDEIVDVDIFNFDGAQFLYKMPVAIKDIAVGDVVVHQNIPMFVVEVPADGKTLYAVDPVNGEKKEIMLARSPFGFNFATKVVNFLGGMFNGSATAENPFGNMWMLMAMGENKDMNSMLPMMMMAQGNNMDPSMMMMFMAMKDNPNDMLPLMFAMQNMSKPVASNSCDGHCHCNKEG